MIIGHQKAVTLLMKTTAIVGTISAAIGLFVGSQLPRNTISHPVSITTFKIKVPFEDWASGFDSQESDKMHKMNRIKPIFRGVNIKDPKKVVVIHQAEAGLVEKLLSTNKKVIESKGHIMKTTKISNWSFQ